MRTLHPPAEGMVVRNAEGFDVGDKVKVKLVGADPYKGFIDFEGKAKIAIGISHWHVRLLLLLQPEPSKNR